MWCLTCEFDLTAAQTTQSNRGTGYFTFHLCTYYLLFFLFKDLLSKNISDDVKTVNFLVFFLLNVNSLPRDRAEDYVKGYVLGGTVEPSLFVKRE